MPVPPQPGPFVILTIFQTQVVGDSDPRGDGGSAIVQYQIGYGTNPNSPQLFDSSLGLDGSGTIDGLSQGTIYYFWARVRNASGWSPWSVRSSAHTKSVPGISGAPFTSPGSKTQTSITIRFNRTSWNGGGVVDTHTVGYSTDPEATVPSVLLTNDINDDTFEFSGLNPGGRYYFWARTHNVYGNSEWSARTPIDLIAGAKVKDGTTWKRAVPYVRDGGVWKLARPWIRTVGFWNTIDE